MLPGGGGSIDYIARGCNSIEEEVVITEKYGSGQIAKSVTSFP